MPSDSFFYKNWVKLSGDPAEFPLNARIFHSVCLISFVALLYNIPFNYLIGLGKVAMASVVILGMVVGSYYMSRFKGKTNTAILATNVLGLIIFSSTYFLNSGVGGPTDLFFLLFLLLSIAISPADEYRFWIPVNVGIFTVMSVFEYFSPASVPDSYPDRLSLYTDHISAYAVVASIAYFCIDYIRSSYEKEKNSAIEKSKAIAAQNEQIIKQNRELANLNAEKNKLMSIVAHDLRSPLGSIQNFLEVLTQYDLNDQEKLEIENNLLNSTKNTISMLSKLLEWSKSQLSGLTVNIEYLNLANLLGPTLAIEEDTATRKEITLTYHIDPALNIYADSDMMQLVVRNIIGNAIKFTKPGGEITLTASNVANNCIIAIHDNGIGIDPEKQQSIFSLNVQSTYGTGNEKGVGLGLLLCLEFIQAQGGAIWFESSAEEGTTFFISVRAAETIVSYSNPNAL